MVILYKGRILNYTDHFNMMQSHKLVIKFCKTLQIEEQRLNTLHKGHNECILILSHTLFILQASHFFSPFFCWFFFFVRA